MDLEILDLSVKRKEIRSLLDGAENRGVNNQTVKFWLKKLEDTAYEIDDILDEWNYSHIKHKMEASAEPDQKVGCSFIPSSCLCFKRVYVGRKAAKKIKKVKAKLAQNLEESNIMRMLHGGLASSQPATNPVSKSRQEQSTSLIDFKIDKGLVMYHKKNDIVSKLMLNAGNTQILSIVGTGGLGKTYLAQLIFSDPQFEKDWLKIWVSVSDPFVVDVVAKSIVEYVGKVRIPPNTNQSDLLLRKLKASVEKKKFLLVLDDVRIEDRDKWEQLYMYLQYGAPGSKILVTTRNERVAKMMDTLDDDIYILYPLSPEKFWSLLRHISLPRKSEEECGEFKGVGKKIARKCKGLPLEAIVLGRLLQFKDLEGWKDVEKSEIWQLENGEVKTFPYLDLSYNELSPSLKLCFSYCAIYPKNYRFHVESLIEEWVALGYLSSVSGNDGGELGRKCFNKLATRYLFQDFEKRGEKIEWCKMHELVRDFALICRKNTKMSNTRCQVCDPKLVSQVQEYHGLFWDKESPLVHCDCVTSVAVLRIENGPPPAGMDKLIRLRWLDVRWTTLSKHDLKIICRLYLLQTLSLTRCNLTEIPQEIGNLVELRRLDLSWNEEIKELPESMYSLVKLQTLSLAYCSLKEIGGEIEKLIELTRLDLSWNRELKELPVSMYSLDKLQTLSLACCSVKEIRSEIRKLAQLRNLDLSGNILLTELPQSMRRLVELQTLSLACCSLKEICKEIGDLTSLTQLDLRWNRELEELPESIHKLVELQILNIEGTKVQHHLPRAVGQLSNLLTLELREFKVGSLYNNFGLLRKVKHSTDSLTLDIHFSNMSEMVELVEDAREAQLKILFQELEKLKISFVCTMNGKEPSSSSSSSKWMELLEALEPHHKLKQLIIWRYEGSALPSWMSSPNNFIKEISLHHLSEVSSLPALGKLPFLEVLYIDHLEELKLIGREFLGIGSASNDDVVAFPKLKELSFYSCPKWEEWKDITEKEEKSVAISIMPCLTGLSISSCKSLKKLPHRILHKASSSLQLLDIEGSTELAKTYRSDTEGSQWRSISKHNSQLRRRWY